MRLRDIIYDYLICNTPKQTLRYLQTLSRKDARNITNAKRIAMNRSRKNVLRYRQRVLHEQVQLRKFI